MSVSTLFQSSEHPCHGVTHDRESFQSHKMKLIAITNTLTAFLLLLGCSCSRDRDPWPEDMAEEGTVELILRMSVNSGNNTLSEKATRANEIDFERPVDIREGVETLRIIIVRPASNNIVEYNDKIILPENERLWNDSKTFRYKVAGGEYKHVYLIGNESSLSAANIARIEAVEEDKPLPSDFRDMLLNSTGGSPYIVNTAENGRYIPMSEIFEFRVKDGVAGGMVEDEVSLFLTRSLSKFSFSVESAPAEVYAENGMTISRIKISGMSDLEWFFPHNTIYNPGKFEISTNKYNGRLITSFTTPAGALTYDHVFTPLSFGIPGSNGNTGLVSSYTPLEYFLESPAGFFEITVTATSNGLEREFTGTLPNLPRMPRNTHTKIHLIFNGLTMDAVATVYPYTAVNLNPSFGFIIPATEILLESYALTLHVEDTVTLGVTIKPDNVTDRTLEWSSSNQQVATVDSKGNITALSVGTADITVKCGNLTGICKLTVEPKKE